MVNGRRVDIPSYTTRPGEEITVREKSRQIHFVREGMEKSTARVVPAWLNLDPENTKAGITGVPGPEDFADIQVDEKLVVEFYSR